MELLLLKGSLEMKTLIVSALALALMLPTSETFANDMSAMVTGTYDVPAGKFKRTKKTVVKRKTVKKRASVKSASKKASTKAQVAKAAAPAKQNGAQEKPEAKIQKVEMTEAEVSRRISGFSHIRNNGKIADEPFKRALAFYSMNQHKVSNSRYLGVIDFSKNSSKKRFCLIDMRSGDVDCMKTSHGRGSDGGSGWASRFSNKPNSYASSLGFYKTLGTYPGKHGLSLRLKGLSDTNSMALERAVVIHAANYVNDSHGGVSGRSHGCPALDPRKTKSVIQKIKGGMIIYAWHGKYM